MEKRTITEELRRLKELISYKPGLISEAFNKGDGFDCIRNKMNKDFQATTGDNPAIDVDLGFKKTTFFKNKVLYVDEGKGKLQYLGTWRCIGKNDVEAKIDRISSNYEGRQEQAKPMYLKWDKSKWWGGDWVDGTPPPVASTQTPSKTSTPSTSTPTVGIPPELKDVTGVQAFQNWLDDNKGEWAYSKRRKVYFKVGKNPKLGFGNYGVNTKRMWNDENVRKEYLASLGQAGTTPSGPTTSAPGFEDYADAGGTTPPPNNDAVSSELQNKLGVGTKQGERKLLDYDTYVWDNVNKKWLPDSEYLKLYNYDGTPRANQQPAPGQQPPPAQQGAPGQQPPPAQQGAPGQQPPPAQQGAPGQQVILPQRDETFFDDYK